MDSVLIQVSQKFDVDTPEKPLQFFNEYSFLRVSFVRGGSVTNMAVFPVSVLHVPVKVLPCGGLGTHWTSGSSSIVPISVSSILITIISADTSSSVAPPPTPSTWTAAMSTTVSAIS